MSKFDYTKGISAMNRGRETRALTSKWSRTGLLKGLEGVHSANMARLLENQAAQLLKEAASNTGTTAATVDGWQNVAFPLVRRVFAQLLANDVVSVQPMSLPSGLIFYMDYKFGTQNPSGTNKLQDYTGNIQGGTSSLAGGDFDETNGRMSPPYELGSAYTQYTASAIVTSGRGTAAATGALTTADVGGKKLNYRDDSWLTADSGDTFYVTNLKTIDIPIANMPSDADLSAYKHYIIHGASGSVAGKIGIDGGVLSNATASLKAGSAKTIRAFTSMPTTGTLRYVISGSGQDMDVAGYSANGKAPDDQVFYVGLEYVVRDTFTNQKVDSVFESNLDSLESGNTIEPVIPEINLSIETTAVTAQPRKLKARWTPELAQDLNAYHDLDAEVELTTILGEEIAQEIDNEILLDLLNAAEGAYIEPGGNSPFSSRALPQTKGASNIAHWSRVPGRYLNESGTGLLDGGGSDLGSSASFSNPLAVTQREWYETLVEKILHVSNQIHKKTLRAKANFIVTSPEVGTILESTLAFRPVMSMDVKETSFGLGVENVGTLNNRFNVFVSPYFPRNRVLVGYKGDSFLETGYVYAPYVPLIVTPTIFAPEDFTPRKGVMTRYAKKVVRPEFYGSVVCHDMGQF